MSLQSEKEQLERYLRGDSPLSRAYRDAGGELPGPDLDRTILEEARQASRRKRPRWLVPASLAAAVLASLGLATFVFERGRVTPSLEQAPPPYAQDRVLKKSAPKPETVIKEEAVRDRKRPAADTPAPRSPAREMSEAERAPGPASTAAPAAAGAPVSLEPEAWLQHIDALRRQGREAEAEASLKAFRERYPNYPIGREGSAR